MTTWKDIARILGSRTNYTETIEQLAVDSRLVDKVEKTVFFAHKGLNNDGHQFIPSLRERGVKFFIVETDEQVKSIDCKYVVVDDAVSALQAVAKDHRSSFDYPVLAITGSNGKTTVKEWLSVILSKKFNFIKSPKSYNSQVGVPLSIWGMNEEHELGVFEAGVSQRGEMQKLAEIIQPDIGLFTCIGAAHAEGFASEQEKITEKAALFKNSSVVICRKDHNAVFEVLSNLYGNKLLTWSTEDNDAYFYFTKVNDTTYQISHNGQDLIFNFPFDFDIWIENALHVVVISLYLGCSHGQIQDGLSKLQAVKMRLEVKPAINQCYLIDDTYNNDLQGLRVALNFLKQQQQRSQKTVILSDLLQTGLESQKVYKQVNDWLKNEEIDRIIAIGPNISKYGDQFTISSEFYSDLDDFFSKPPHFQNEMVLVKGARNFGLERIVRWLEEQSHRTVLEINFEAIVHNLTTYKKLLNPVTNLMVMVKAFAYGGGSLEIANLLQYHKVDYLGVAFTDEAIQLRQNGITLPIMVMNSDFHNPDLFNEYNLEPEVYNLNGIRSLSGLDQNVNVHLKLETGMNRLGFTSDQVDELLSLLKNNQHIKIKAIFSHLASADDKSEDEFTDSQIKRFEAMYEKITDEIGYEPMRHLLNSAGISRWPNQHYEMVRLGIGLYGFDSGKTGLNLRPISTLKSRVSMIKNVKKGETIGYGRVGKARKDTKIAIIPIGYADGYTRLFSNGAGKMNINGHLVPTIGNVCMDMTMVDIGDLDISPGDEVIVFGARPTITDLAKWCQTIPYEILTNVSQRVKRTYTSE